MFNKCKEIEQKKMTINTHMFIGVLGFLKMLVISRYMYTVKKGWGETTLVTWNVCLQHGFTQQQRETTPSTCKHTIYMQPRITHETTPNFICSCFLIIEENSGSCFIFF